MTNIIRLDGQPHAGADDVAPAASMSTLRLITGMDLDEFSSTVAEELGWPVPLFVYLEWERDGAHPPPPEALDAARKVALRNPIGSRSATISRRRCLGGLVGFSALAATGFPARTLPLAAPFAIGGSGRKWRASPETAADLDTLIASYRRAYAGKAAAADLLPGTTGLMHLLIDLGSRDQWPGDPAQLAPLVGQAALLAGLLHLMGPRDLRASQAHYNVALQAAREGEDWDLAAYVLGSLAFLATSARRQADARALRDAAWEMASRRANPRTRAWTAALASELHARDGDETASHQLLRKGFEAIECTRDEPSWKGVGWFDETRLIGYEGGNLVLLGHYQQAESLLRGSLARLDPTRLKHRCTLSADLAMALAHRAEVEESCARATDALTLARAIEHRESVDRVRRVHFRLLRWKTHSAVRQLTERLEAA